MNHMSMNMNVQKPELVEALAVVLADNVNMYFKAQGHHWNVMGPDFGEFHEFFEKIYEDVLDQFDPVAENMRKLGAMAPFRLQDFIDLSEIQDSDCASDAMLMMQDLYVANNIVIENINVAFKIASELDEQGIADYLAARDDMHKKWRWQLQAYMTPTVSRSQYPRLGKDSAAQPLIADDVFEDDIPVVEQLMDDHNGCPLCGPGIGCVCPGCEGGYCLCDDSCSCHMCHVMLAAAGEADTCPPATQDIQLNLKNRQNAIDNVGYGPLNPKEPNDEFWQEKADKWGTTPDEAKKSLCANCVFFVRTPEMLDCISQGIQQGDSSAGDADAAIDQAELGYCEALDFKCAASRTCNAWAVGGPITSAGVIVPEEQALADALIEITEKFGKFNSDDTGVWAGYETAEENENKEIGVTCANCMLYAGGTECKIIDVEVEPEGYCRFALIPDGVVTASASRKAPKKDRIYGSKRNPKGSAAGGKKIVFSQKVEKALSAKVTEHNKNAKPGRKATLAMLKAVYRRGSGAYSSSHRPGKTRDQWAMARVNAFLKLLRSGSPANPNYKQDNDLLPKAHPKSSKGEAAVIQHELLQVALKSAEEYGSPEHAIFSMAEYSGLGYEIIPALRGAWLRGVRDGDVPFNRAYELATKLYSSKDADLLPRKRRGDK